MEQHRRRSFLKGALLLWAQTDACPFLGYAQLACDTESPAVLRLLGLGVVPEHRGGAMFGRLLAEVLDVWDVLEFETLEVRLPRETAAARTLCERLGLDVESHDSGREELRAHAARERLDSPLARRLLQRLRASEAVNWPDVPRQRSGFPSWRRLPPPDPDRITSDCRDEALRSHCAERWLREVVDEDRSSPELALNDFGDPLPEAWRGLTDSERRAVWDAFGEHFDFCPNMTSFPGIQEPPDSLTWSIAHAYGSDPRYRRLTLELSRTLNDAFRGITLRDGFLYALDWQHSCYRYSPHEPFAYLHEDAWPIPVFPNGDYHIFVEPRLRWGIFGHPWERTLCAFGADLLRALQGSSCELLRYPLRAAGKRCAAGSE